MNAARQNYLDRYVESFERCRDVYHDIMSDTSCEACIFLQWMLDNNINPYFVFPDEQAEGFTTLQGFIDIYSLLTHAIYDDGYFACVKLTVTNSLIKISSYFEPYPLIVFYCPEDQEEFKNKVIKARVRHLLSCENAELEILKDLAAYVIEYERVDKKREDANRLCEEKMTRTVKNREERSGIKQSS